MKLVTWLAVVLLSAPAHALTQGCFSTFDKKVTQPLIAPPKLLSGAFSSTVGVRKEDEVEFAGARALVEKPIKEVYTWLLDHKNWKDMSKTEMKVYESEKPGFMEFHRVDVKVNVWGFITLPWTEEWAYGLLEGTEKEPKEILVSYQKVDGTWRIKRLCGSVLLKDAGGKTDIFFYEEALAQHYPAKRILEMHEANFKTLNNGKAIPAAP